AALFHRIRFRLRTLRGFRTSRLSGNPPCRRSRSSNPRRRMPSNMPHDQSRPTDGGGSPPPVPVVTIPPATQPTNTSSSPPPSPPPSGLSLEWYVKGDWPVRTDKKE